MDNQTTEDFDPSSTTSTFDGYRRGRSARRLRHEAEIKVFQGRVGDLEQVRQQLGLRAVQMAELLRVHPSAWTRWVKEGKAPPHIFRMLEWYLELQTWRTQGHQVMAPGMSQLPEIKALRIPETSGPESSPTPFVYRSLWIIAIGQILATGALWFWVLRAHS